MVCQWLQLYKSDFKFSAAHFLIFDGQRAERLHGHNYRVRLAVQLATLEKSGRDGKFGYHVDFGKVKKVLRQLIAAWDEYVLLPVEHPDIHANEKSGELEIRFRDRRYVFPANEVRLLPITNTSVEELSRCLAELVAAELETEEITAVKISVEETLGQAASTMIRVARD